jgi:ferredoxin
MPKVLVHKNNQRHEGEVKENSNLVVRAGIRQFPYPHLSYGCGMGKCGKCTSRIIAGAEHLPAPNWKEVKVLGSKLEEGYRLICQLWINHDIELEQGWTPAGAVRGATPGLSGAPREPT